VQQADLDSKGDTADGGTLADGDIDNTATVSSTEVPDESASAFVDLVYAASLNVTKLADVASVDSAGDLINYTITVANTGNVSLTGVTVTDPLLGALSGPTESLSTNGVLNVGESWTYTDSYTVQQQDIDDNGIDGSGNADNDGDIDNTVTADSTETPANTASEAVAVLQNKSLAIAKDADVFFVDSTSDIIHYTLVVTNTGNAAIANVKVDDPFTIDEAPVLAGSFNIGDADTDGLLDVTETWQYTASHQVTQDELNAGGTIVNTATVTGTGATPEDDSATVTVTPMAPPVVLDLDGDGLEFVAMGDASNQALFDFNGDGTKETAAWVGPDDGFLVYDANGDRRVNDGSEIAFADMTAEADTDLEALQVVFDSNHDGLLTAADEQFSRFGVWQDANGNGSTEVGEFKTLGEMGIVSLGLRSDGGSYSAANEQVTVHGEASFMYQDGREGLLGDVSLAIGGPAHSSADPQVGGVGSNSSVFSDGINPFDLVLSRQADNLRIAVYGSNDQATVQNWFGGSSHQVKTIQADNGHRLVNTQVNQLIDAMAGFSSDNGMAWDQGLAAKPEEVAAVVAASWQ
jgi:uncharacterized repeat protein (TIGR01451 family)